eukprot:1669215-Amphidinium_carterae.1
MDASVHCTRLIRLRSLLAPTGPNAVFAIRKNAMSQSILPLVRVFFFSRSGKQVSVLATKRVSHFVILGW